MRKVSKSTIVRTIVLAFTLLNLFLSAIGANPLPFAEEEFYEIVSTIVTVAASIWAWWKNNSFTAEAIEADNLLTKLKKSKGG